jgi:hypothetical protein
MSSRRTLIVVASASALTILSACRERQALTQKPVAVYVNPDLTLNEYVEPGQRLEWHVDNPKSPTVTFTPQDGLCDPATLQRKAMHHQPAGCVVAPQTFAPGDLFHTFTYMLQSDTPPGEPAPAPVRYAIRVGSCGPSCP